MKLLAAASAVVVASVAQAGAAVAPVPPIVFSSDRSPALRTPHRYAVTLDGRSRTGLSLPREGASPDGRFVARIGGVDGDPAVEIVRAGQTTPSTVIRGFPEPPGLVPVVTRLTWSPNSKRIAITVLRPCPPYVRGCNTSEVWVAGVGSRKPTRVATGRAPVWAPDSVRVAVVAYYGPWSGDSVFAGPAVPHGLRPLARGTLPAWSPRGASLAYVSPAGIGVTPAARRRPRLVARGATDARPVWSPSGRELAFVLSDTLHNGGTLYVADLAKRRVRVLAHAPAPDGWPALPAWSPNGRLIAFVVPRRTFTELPGGPVYSFDRQIVVVAKTGGRLRQLTREPPWASFGAVGWNRAGTRVTYTFELFQSDYELFALDPEGGRPRQLTDDLVDDLAPSWAPDGEHVVFQRAHVQPGPQVAVSGLYVRSLATGEERLLRPLSGRVYPVWSPVGGTIAIVVDNRIVLVDATDGSIVRTFETLSTGPFAPAWAPDGGRLAVSAWSPAVGSTEIFVVDVRVGDVTAITSVNAALSPAWSPDGRWISFVGRRDERDRMALWIVRPDGTGLTSLSGAVDFAGAPAWSPDSRRIVYAVKPSYDRYELHLVDVDGRNDRVLYAAIGSIDGLDWRR